MSQSFSAQTRGLAAPEHAGSFVDVSDGSRAQAGIRRSLLAYAVGAALLGGSAAAYAQQPAQDPQAREQVVVTGTRITQPDFLFSNPVVSVDSETVLSSGRTNLVSYLSELPALTGSLDSFDTGGSNAFIGGAGLNLLDLRNLGEDRTLVLVNGRRHVATLAESASIDINSIPLDLVERVDIMTGGASAVYGADGVTGVVNFVLRDDFEGFRLRAQANSPSDPGADDRLLAATFGRNFAGGRGNVTVAAEYAEEEELYGYDRDFNGGRPGILTRFVRNPADTADPPVGDGADDDPAIPDRIPLERTAFGDTSRCGAIYITGANSPSPDFNCDGSPWDIGDLPQQTVNGQPDFPVLPFYQVGGDATLQDDYVGFSTILPEIERASVNVNLGYELGGRARLFGELKHAESDVRNFGQPSFDFFLFFDPDNPFIPAPLQAAAAAEGGLFMSRDNFDLGVRGDEIERETQRAVIGFEGDMDWASYEVSVNYGKSEIVANQTNNRFEDRYFAALDVVDNGGTPDCRVNVDPTATPADFPDPVTYDPAAGACVPLNLFGEGVASPEAVDWVMQRTTAVDELEQKVLSGYLNGDTAGVFSLPGGPMGWAFGAEHREESSESRPDEADTAGATFGNVIQPNFGEFDVSEVFAEVSLPLLSAAPLAEELTLEAAYRYSDYSTIGETGTWKLGAMWSPIGDVTFRATVAEAVRAPNIGELFGAENQDFEFIDDPCDVSLVGNGSQYREANCAEILSALGVDPGTFVDPNSSSVGGVSGGNPDLQEETADTRTLGVVFQPRFAESLSVAVDYYDIELTDAVAAVSAEEIAERCVDAPTLMNQFCPLIERGPNGGIDSFRQTGVNLASFRTTGVDYTFNYSLDPGALGAERDWGVFDFRLVGNKLQKLEFVPSPGADVDDDLGEGPGASFAGEAVPEWQATLDLTWVRGPLTVNYGFQWFDETQRISNANIENDPDFIGTQYYYYDAKSSHDVHLRFAMDNGFSVFGGVNNFTDERSAIDEIAHPASPVGRTYYLGLTGEFGR